MNIWFQEVDSEDLKELFCGMKYNYVKCASLLYLSSGLCDKVTFSSNYTVACARKEFDDKPDLIRCIISDDSGNIVGIVEYEIVRTLIENDFCVVSCLYIKDEYRDCNYGTLVLQRFREYYGGLAYFIV